MGGLALQEKKYVLQLRENMFVINKFYKYMDVKAVGMNIMKNRIRYE